MTKGTALEILNKHDAIKDGSDGKEPGLFSLGWYLSFLNGEKEATLDGTFSIEELEAIVWFMKEHSNATLSPENK